MGKSYRGDAIVTTITANINASDTSVAIASSSGWPSGSGGKPFVVEITSADGTTHEKLLIASRSGTTLTVSSRGYDDTVAASFLAGATITHVFDASSAQDFADHIDDLTPHVGSDLLRPSTHDLAARHTIGDGTSTSLLAGGVPTPIGTAASAGSGNAVARGNHSHALDASIAGSGLGLTAGVLAVLVDDSTIAISGDNLLVKDAGIVTAKIASQAITTAKVAPANITEPLLADNSVDSRAYVDGSIDPEHLASGLSVPRICTSGTRPSSPAEGQAIYETDTGNVLWYLGATLGWRPPWNTPWGYIDSADSTTDQSGIGGTAVNITGASVTWTAIATRRYRIDVHIPRCQVDTALVEAVIQITDAGNSVVEQANVSGGANQVFTVSFFDIGSGLSGSTTRKIRARAGGSGTLSVDGASTPARIMVTDIGPNGNAP